MSDRCPSCVGTGEILGGGMQMEQCRNCAGTGKIAEVVSDEAAIKKLAIMPDKRSRTYKDAIRALMTLHNCDKREAKILFDKQYDKLEA